MSALHGVGCGDRWRAAVSTACRRPRVIPGAITARNPKTRYTIGRDTAVIVRLARVAPDRLLDRLLRRNLRPHYSKASS